MSTAGKSEQEKIRRESLDEIRKLGIDPYGKEILMSSISLVFGTCVLSTVFLSIGLLVACPLGGRPSLSPIVRIGMVGPLVG